MAAIVALGIAWGLMMHTMGWAQSSYFAGVRALADGQAEVDPWHWETQDVAWIDGHYYSVKAPGLAGASLGPYKLIEAVGGDELARDAAENARRSDHPRWTLASSGVDPPYREYGFSRARAVSTWDRIENNAAIVWGLTLFTAVIPAVLLLLLVRWVAEKIEPGYGTAAAITLGVGTILLTFGSEYLSHALAATLGFGAFALLFKERAGPGNLALVGAAGLTAGLAVVCEYPLFLSGTVLFVYALTRPERRLARGAVFAVGAVLGSLPALAFNVWAFGDPMQFAYGDAIVRPGLSGHAEVGLNDDGLFGITFPTPLKAGELLFAGRGLITLTPVLVMAVVGVWLIGKRREWRTEARVLGAIAAVFFLYNSGYWLPMGGGTPGPRFLIPAMPFVAVGLASAYRHRSALTLGLAIPSGLCMLLGMLTFPLIGGGTYVWVTRFGDGSLEHTLLTALGVENSWLAILPVLVAVAAAVTFAVLATPRTTLGDIRPALVALLGWGALALIRPAIAGDRGALANGGTELIQMVLVAIVASASTLLVLSYRERRGERAGPLPSGPEPALRGRIS